MLINGGLINGAVINGGGSNVAFPPIYIPKLFIRRISIILLVTGAADSLPDVLIPISNISGSLNATGAYRLQVVVPDGLTYGADLIARSNGSFVVQATEYLGDGTTRNIFSNEYSEFKVVSTRGTDSWSLNVSGLYVPPEIAPIFGVVTLERFSFTGGTNQQVVASQGSGGDTSGSLANNANNPQAVTPARIREYTDPPILIFPGSSAPPVHKYDVVGQFLEGIDSGGKRNISCMLNADLRPLDFLILFNSIEIEVGTIAYRVTNDNALMFVTEL